jgi:hypothetical protein
VFVGEIEKAVAAVGEWQQGVLKAEEYPQTIKVEANVTFR